MLFSLHLMFPVPCLGVWKMIGRLTLGFHPEFFLLAATGIGVPWVLPVQTFWRTLLQPQLLVHKEDKALLRFLDIFSLDKQKLSKVEDPEFASRPMWLDKKVISPVSTLKMSIVTPLALFVFNIQYTPELDAILRIGDGL